MVSRKIPQIEQVSTRVIESFWNLPSDANDTHSPFYQFDERQWHTHRVQSPLPRDSLQQRFTWRKQLHTIYDLIAEDIVGEWPN